MSIAHQSPIVDAIVFNIIRQYHFQKFKFSTKQILDSSVIPKVSDNALIRKGFQQSIMPSVFLNPVTLPEFGKVKADHSKQVSEKKPELQKNIQAPPGFTESIMEEWRLKQDVSKSKNTQSLQKVQIRPPIPPKPPLSRGPTSIPINLFQNPPNYGKLNPVFRDKGVKFIECPGPDKNIIVTKNNQKQKTNIILSKQEIQMLLDNISNKTKIPLLTGVFRVSWDNYIINAVISDTLERRFLTKKEE